MSLIAYLHKITRKKTGDNIVYEQKSDNTEAIEIAQRLLEQGVDEEIVSKSTKLSKQAIKKLKQN